MQAHLKVLVWRKYLTLKFKKQFCGAFFPKLYKPADLHMKIITP